MEKLSYTFHMSKKRKIATNIPDDLLSEATKLSGLNQTSAIIEGLKELIRTHKVRKLIALKGKLQVDYNPKFSRQR